MTDNKNQSDAATSALTFFKWNLNNWTQKRLEEQRSHEGAWPKVEDREALVDEARAYLPDHLVERTVDVWSEKVIPQEGWDGKASSFSVEIDGVGTTFVSKIDGASYVDMVKLRQMELDFSARPDRDDKPASWLSSVSALMSAKAEDSDYVVVLPDDAQVPADCVERFTGRVLTEREEMNFSALVLPKNTEYDLPAGSFVLGNTYFGVK